jgi:hypothetical protein
MLSLAVLTACALFAHGSLGTDGETVWGTVVFARHGERTPLIIPGPDAITPLGAIQANAAGALIRQRYVVPISNFTDGNITTSSQISGIDPFFYDSNSVFVLAPDDEVIVNSAQAFMQGVYPPLDYTVKYQPNPPESVLANGTITQAPLGGYQYANIHVASSLDYNSVWLAGNLYCPEYSVASSVYYETDLYQSTEDSKSAFYKSLEPGILNGVITDDTVSYQNAYQIYDYVNYMYTHNSTVADSNSVDVVNQLRALADAEAFALNGNLTNSGFEEGDMINAISGRTLAAKILGLLQYVVEKEGQYSKLNILFGSHEPFLAFFALAGLPEKNANFYGIPDFASLMAFELFSVDSVVNDTSSFPDESALQVRFLFRNGTDEGSDLNKYPLFSAGVDLPEMPWETFQEEMSAIMMNTVGDWCDACASESIFCAVEGTSSSDPFSSCSSSEAESHHKKVTPAVAGVIGAAVTLAFFLLVGALAMLIGGVRFHRNASKSRHASFGGFKGAEKMASDPDLVSSGIVSGATAPAGASVVKGHERVGSWELGQNNGAAAGDTGVKEPERSWGGQEHDEEGFFHAPTKVDDRI